jgi:putative phosphoesterase
LKIGLISDTHGDLEAWNRAIDIFIQEEAETILHAGDILNHGVFNPVKPVYDPLELADRINNSPIPIIFAKGNCDSKVDSVAIEYIIQSPFAFAVFDGKRFVVVHGDKHTEEELTNLGKRYNLDFIVRGHTHEYKINNGKPMIINPGSPSLPKNNDELMTIGLISDTSVKIIDIKSKTVVKEQGF